MPDADTRAAADQRDLRDTRTALNRAREEIAELRAENERLRGGQQTVTMTLESDAAAVRAAIARGQR